MDRPVDIVYESHTTDDHHPSMNRRSSPLNENVQPRMKTSECANESLLT
jgi:hypothetical protein